MDNDSLILVFKVGVKDIEPDKVAKYIDNVKTIMSKTQTTNITMFFLPYIEKETIEIECLNPKLVTAELFKEAETKLVELNSKIDKLLNFINE